MSGNKCIHVLEHYLLRSKNTPRKAKVILYTAVLPLIVMYASESWTTNKTEQKVIKVSRYVRRKYYRRFL